MKYKKIDNILFRMEKPEPLMTDTEHGVLIALTLSGRIGDMNKDDFDMPLIECSMPFVYTGTEHPGSNRIRIPQTCLTPSLYRFDIVGYPIEKGSAEWRNYQLRNGKCVFRPKDSEYYQAGGQGRIIGRLVSNGEFNSTWNVDTFMRDDSDGWQLYEEPEPANPERWVCYECGIKDSRTGHFPGCSRIVKPQPQPAPAFRVEDLVKYDIDTYLRVIEASGAEKTLCKTLSGVIVYPYTSCLTKASPSEVIVKIGCLSGTVTYAISDDCFLLAKVYDPQHRACCIDMSMLDTATRELVKALLAAQEEK